MRHQSSGIHDQRLARHSWIGTELFGIHAAENHVRPRRVPMAEHAAAIFADMQMAVIPPVRGNVSGNIPSTAAQITHEHSASTQPARSRRKTARHDMLLMTMHYRGPFQILPEPQTHRIILLISHPPWMIDDMDLKFSHSLAFCSLIGKRDQHGRNFLCHVTRQLQRIAFGSSHNSPTAAEESWHDVQYAKLLHVGYVFLLSGLRLDAGDNRFSSGLPRSHRAYDPVNGFAQ